MVPSNNSNGISQLQRLNFQSPTGVAQSVATTTNTVTNGNANTQQQQQPQQQVPQQQQQQSNSGPNTPNSQAAEEEPLYVNAKQYHRILKRRQARNKLENEGRIPKGRQVTLDCINLIRVFVFSLKCDSFRKSFCMSLDTNMQ